MLFIILVTLLYLYSDVQKQVLLGNKVAGHNENSEALNMLGRKTLNPLDAKILVGGKKLHTSTYKNLRFA